MLIRRSKIRKIVLFISIGFIYIFCEAQPSISQIIKYKIKKTNREPIKKEGKWGFVNHKTKQLVIPCIYDTLKLYKGYFAEVKLNGKWGYVSTDGKQTIKPNYTSTSTFNNGYARVENDTKVGIIDTLGNVIIPIMYKSISVFEEGYFRVYSGKNFDSVAVLNTKGKIIIPFNKYLSIEPIQKGTSIVGNRIKKDFHKMNNMVYGKINIKTNKKIIPIKYRHLSLFKGETNFHEASNDSANFGFYDNNALINNKGRELTAFKYYGFERFHLFIKNDWVKTKCFVTYRKNDGHMFEDIIDKKGNKVLPTKHEETEDFTEVFNKLPRSKKRLIYKKCLRKKYRRLIE